MTPTEKAQALRELADWCEKWDVDICASKSIFSSSMPSGALFLSLTSGTMMQLSAESNDTRTACHPSALRCQASQLDGET